MESLISIRREDSAFVNYLKGTFSNEWRAIPTENLNLDVKKDYITFKLVAVERVPQVSWLKFIYRVLRLEGLSLSIGGLLAAVFYLTTLNRDVNLALAAACFLPVTSLHIAMNLFNDYYDHLKGVDQIGSVKSIQMGWVRAIDLYNWGWVFLGFGIFSGLAVLAASTQPTYLVAMLAGFGILEFSSNRFGLKYLGYGEVTLFLLTGPLLVIGFIWTVSSSLELRDLLLGFFLGTLTVTFMHLNNMRDILSAAHAGVINLATRYGFDRAKKIAGLLLIGNSLVWWALLVMMNKSPWAFGPWLIGLIVHKFLFAQIIQSPSPMASVLRQTVRRRYLFHSFIVILAVTSFFVP